MPAKRKYHVRGTKDFIVLAGIFFFLCLWSIKDAWYPSPKVLKKHPREVRAFFETSGSVVQLYVSKGDSVVEEQLLAELRKVKFEEDLETAKNAYSEAKEKHDAMDEALRIAVKGGGSSERIAELKLSRDEARTAMDESYEKVNESRMKLDAARLLSPSKGLVTDVLVSMHAPVEAGQDVIVIDPKDHFYVFNKSLAIFSFIAFWVFMGVHILAR